MIRKDKEEREQKEKERRLKKLNNNKNKEKREKDELDKLEREKRDQQEKEIMDKLEQEEELKKERFQKEIDKLDKQRREIFLREKEKKKRTLKAKLLKEKEKKEKERQHFEELLAKEKERIKNKKETESQINNESDENNTNTENSKSNLRLRNNAHLKKNLLNVRSKLYNKGNSLSSNKKYDTLDKETDDEDILEDKEKAITNSRKFGFSSGKHEKFVKVKFGDPLNPYMTNWPSSFLKIGYNVGFHYSQFQKGVPLLRIQKLKNNVVFPPLYTIQYNTYTNDKTNISNETEKLCCNSVIKRLFNPMRNHFGFSDLQKNKSKNHYQTYYNKAFLSKDNQDNEINIHLLKNKKNISEKNFYEIKDNNINEENKEKNNKDVNKEILILDNNKLNNKE